MKWAIKKEDMPRRVENAVACPLVWVQYSFFCLVIVKYTICCTSVSSAGFCSRNHSKGLSYRASCNFTPCKGGLIYCTIRVKKIYYSAVSHARENKRLSPCRVGARYGAFSFSDCLNDTYLCHDGVERLQRAFTCKSLAFFLSAAHVFPRIFYHTRVDRIKHE